MGKKAKTISFWCLFILIDLFVAGVIAEGWTRLFIPVKNTCWEMNEELGIKRCPNQTYYGYIENGYSNVSTTNSEGFHDIERKKAKAAGTYRIHVYGDSIIVGDGVPIKDTIPSLLEDFLRSEELPLELEVLNMAAVDSTSSELVIYEKVGVNYDPDMVICYFMDDFGDNIIETHPKEYYPYHLIGENGELVYVKPVLKDITTPWERVKRSSMLYRLLANKWLESKLYHNMTELGKKLAYHINRIGGAEEEGAVVDPDEWRRKILIEKSWPLTLRLIELFRDTVEKNGAEFVLVDGKLFNDLNVGTVYSNKDLEAFCKEKNIHYIPVYDLHDKLLFGPDKSEYFFKDNHPTPKGNKELTMVVAEGVRKILEEERR